MQVGFSNGCEKNMIINFFSNHYRTRINIIVITKKLRIESQRVTRDMHHYDTTISIANKKVLVGSDNDGFAEGSDNGWIVCMYVSK